MPDYDFSALNDKEFEKIAIDLLSVFYDTNIERFKAGRDGGADGRFYSYDDKEIIIQCKHYFTSGFSSLLNSLKKKNNGKNEFDKVKSLNPKKYIFVTSLPLSRLNKQKIREFFSPYITRDDDIIGNECLNDILSNNPKIEEKHYKLWISSTNVLKAIFNNSIKGRSRYLLEEIRDQSKLYVLTKNHDNAIEVLEKNHTVIISGDPGIGKTTLAENICLQHAAMGYELCVIESSVEEAEDVFDEGEPQIFYFDDFLGSNYLEALQPHEDSHISRFISRIKNSKNKKFILTSRSNILNQGYNLSDTFKSRNIKKNEYLILIDSFSKVDKAKILYNHIWFGNLDENFVDVIYFDKRYLKIIEHHNFNPRLIAFITDKIKLEGKASEQYWDYISETLDNPKDIWANIFENQIDQFSRNLVLLTVFNKNSISEQSLSNSYYMLNKKTGLSSTSHKAKDFHSVAKLISSSLLNREVTNDKDDVSYSLFNPSIADYVLSKYAHDTNTLSNIFVALNSIRSLEVLKSIKQLLTNNIETYNHLVLKVIDATPKNSINTSYFLLLLHITYTNNLIGHSKTANNLILSLVNLFVNNRFTTPCTSEILDLTQYCQKKRLIELDDFGFILTLTETSDDDPGNIDAILYYINAYSIEDEEIHEALRVKVNAYLDYKMQNFEYDLDLDKIQLVGSDQYGFGYDDDALDLELTEVLFSYNDADFFNDISDYIDADIINNIDKDDLVSRYAEDMYRHDAKRVYSEGNSGNSESSFIEDLFQRT